MSGALFPQGHMCWDVFTFFFGVRGRPGYTLVVTGHGGVAVAQQCSAGRADIAEVFLGHAELGA